MASFAGESVRDRFDIHAGVAESSRSGLAGSRPAQRSRRRDSSDSGMTNSRVPGS